MARACPVCGAADRPLLADWCSGAGGAGRGYQLAGFHTVGYDIRPQPRYPGCFVLGDVMAAPLDGFDAFHGSPPCEDHMRSPMRQQQPHGTGWLLDAVRDRFEKTGCPWVLENVPGAPLRADYRLCGCMFGLEVVRERWFETSWRAFELRPPCYHPDPVVNPMRTRHGPWYRKHGRVPTRAEVAAAMGIDWMVGEQIKQAIPPAYTEYIGGHLAAEVRAARGNEPARDVV
jgi:DNA (cytosine-5)-methyltransferase 1